MAIQKTSITDILQLINAMSAGNRQQIAEQNNLAKQFDFGIESTFDNQILLNNKKLFDNYYSSNEANMNEETRIKYEMLSQRFKNQEKLNNQYLIDKEQIKNIGTQVESALIDYSNVSDNINLSNEDKQKLRKEKMDIVMNLVSDYTQTSGNFKTKHSSRLGTKAFQSDSLYVDNLNELFTFGIVQAEDDYILDSAEARALNLGLQTGSYGPIKDYRINEANTNRALDSRQMEQTENLYETYGLAKEINNNISEYLTLKTVVGDIEGDYTEKEKEEARQILLQKFENQSFYEDDKGNQYLYEDLFETESDAYAFSQDMQKTEDDAFDKLKNIDEIYTKRTGNSYLKGININESIKDDINTIFGIEKPGDGDGDDDGGGGGDDDGGDFLNIDTATRGIVKNKETAVKYVNRINNISKELETLKSEYDKLSLEKENDYLPLEEIKKEIASLKESYGIKTAFLGQIKMPPREVVESITGLDYYNGGKEEMLKLLKPIRNLITEKRKLEKELNRKWKGIYGQKGDKMRFLEKDMEKLNKTRTSLQNRIASIKEKQD